MQCNNSLAYSHKLAFYAFLAILLSGCAGIGSKYSTPAPRHQIDFDVYAVTPDSVAQLRREPFDSQPSFASQGDYVYLIGPGDVLDIFVSDLAQPTAGENGTVGMHYVVNEAGDIFLPLHGPLNVEGKSIGEAYVAIRSAISRFIADPQVNIRIVEFRSKSVTIAGDVDSPGSLPITDRAISLAEALVSAGPRSTADLRSVALKRDGRERKIDAVALMERPDFGKGLLLRDDDVVVVPKNTNAVYVVGEAPNRVEPIDPYNHSLATVLLDAEGGTYLQAGAAKPSHVFVVRRRQGASGNMGADVYHLNAKSPEAMLLAQDFQMRNGDVVYVATRQITRYNRFVSQILPSIQSLLGPAVIFNQLDDN